MGNIENIQAHKWQKGQSGNPSGRKKKDRVDEALVEVLGKIKAKQYCDLTAAEYNKWLTVLVTAPTSALQALVKSDETPSLVKNYAMAILTDTKAGRTNTVKQIADRLFGKAIQKMELTGAEGTPLIPARTLTKEEAKQLMESMDKEY